MENEQSKIIEIKKTNLTRAQQRVVDALREGEILRVMCFTNAPPVAWIGERCIRFKTFWAIYKADMLTRLPNVSSGTKFTLKGRPHE